MKPHRAHSRQRLKVSEIALSDRASFLLANIDTSALLHCVRHLQAEWLRVRRAPGHVVVLDLTVGETLTGVMLCGVLGGTGGVRAVIVTPLEAVVMRARMLDPAAPGTVSDFRRVTL